MSNAKMVQRIMSCPNDRLEELFTKAFEEAVSATKGVVELPSFECTVVKDLAASPMVDVRVFGIAGGVTLETFCQRGDDGTVKAVAGGLGNVGVTLDDGTVVPFVVKACQNLNANDFLVTYEVA